MTDIKTLDKENVANTYNRADLLIVKGHGCTVLDENGKEYIDFGSGIAVNSMGVTDDGWVEAVTEQVKKVAHTSNLYYSEPCARLASMLTERTGMKKVFFSNSGAEANEFAIKCARKYSFDKYGRDRYEIITLKGGFHGRTMATITATAQDVFHTYFDPFLEGFVYSEPEIQDTLSKISDKTCAVMMELVQGEGGVNVLDVEYVQKVAEVCKEKDILLIIDEVQTGNGRTGTLYAYEQYGITPDILSTAKGLAGGLPLGATMVGNKCEFTMTAGTHGSTFGGNPVCASGGVYVLNSLTEEFLEDVKEKGKIIKERLLMLKGVKGVTGMGLMIGVSVDNAVEVKNKCLEKGLIVLTAKDKIRLLPALNISVEELNKGINILESVLG
ncbi:MAG: acetylornithine/succinylornithine family transaminase [Clostridia bacterium]|nr:acetylornithine/succinylornithine family transaminase [Clostridia bacterium]